LRLSFPLYCTTEISILKKNINKQENPVYLVTNAADLASSIRDPHKRRRVAGQQSYRSFRFAFACYPHLHPPFSSDPSLRGRQSEGVPVSRDCHEWPALLAAHPFLHVPDSGIVLGTHADQACTQCIVYTSLIPIWVGGAGGWGGCFSTLSQRSASGQ
jgi:hypothetical protein